MLFELVILAGCHGQACRVERPILERKITKSVLVKVEKEVTKEVVRERKVRRFRVWK